MPYYIFTNYYEKAPFVINTIRYLTPLHYYQSEKFTDPIIKQRIINAQTARMATQLANLNKNLIIKDFNDNGVMLSALRAKFSQYPDLASELVATMPKQLINHSLEDSYWADGGDGTGSNYLGRLLMQVRDELNNGSLSTSKPYVG